MTASDVSSVEPDGERKPWVVETGIAGGGRIGAASVCGGPFRLMGATPRPTLFVPALPGVVVVPDGGRPDTGVLVALVTAGMSRSVDVDRLLRSVAVWLFVVAVDAFLGRGDTVSIGAVKRAGIGALDATDRLLATEATDDTEGDRMRLAATDAAVAGEFFVGSEILGLLIPIGGLMTGLASLVEGPVF